jgi:hypothetical protein
VLSDDQRVLLVLNPTYGRKQPKKEHHEVEVMLGLARDTCSCTDRFLTASGGSTMVIVGVRTADYGKLVDYAAKLDPRLQPWAEGAGKAPTGFILSAPLAAAWIDDPVGVDEWHRYNELVHRTAELAVRGVAPKLSDWLMVGLGWHVEDTVLGNVYCFPYRSGFVTDAEHTDWGTWLANNFKAAKRKKDDKPPSLSMAEFADWRQDASKDEFATGKAYVAFGVARFLAQEHAGKVKPLLDQCRAAIEKGSKVMISETEWQTNSDYRIPAAEQLAMLEGVQAGFLAKVTEYFQKKKACERRPVAKK